MPEKQTLSRAQQDKAEGKPRPRRPVNSSRRSSIIFAKASTEPDRPNRRSPSASRRRSATGSPCRPQKGDRCEEDTPKRNPGDPQRTQPPQAETLGHSIPGNLRRTEAGRQTGRIAHGNRPPSQKRRPKAHAGATQSQRQ